MADGVALSLESLIIQFPLIGILLWVMIFYQKRLDQAEQQWRSFFAEQRALDRETLQALRQGNHEATQQHIETFSRALETQQKFFDLLHQADREMLQQLRAALEAAAGQISLNTATVSEVAKVDDIVDRLLEFLSIRLHDEEETARWKKQASGG